MTGVGKYRRKDGSLTHEHFQLSEFVLTAQMRCDGISDDGILAKAKNDNVYQFPTTTQATTFARGMLNRLDALQSEGLVGIVSQGISEQAAQINLYAMMRVYNIIAAFMVEEIGERFLTLNYTLDSADINAFMTRYRSQNPDAATWGDDTVKRIRTVLKEVLVKSGYLADKSSTELLPVFIGFTLEETMRANGDEAWLPAFNCMGAIA